MKFTIGTDPEFFLKKKTTKEDRYISAIPYIKGTKEAPHILPNGAGLQWDNVAIEFASTVSSDKWSFIGGLETTLKHIQKLLNPYRLYMVCTPSAYFPEEEIQSQEAKEFGCSPDFNVWDRSVNEAPVPLSPVFRSCGGHVHVGHPSLSSLEAKETMVKAMDVTCGLVSLILDNNKEAIERRTLYGKAGCFRPTKYGIEYRTLSNFWLKSPLFVELIYSLTKDALMLASKGEFLKDINPDWIQDSINNPKQEVNPSSYRQVVEKYISGESSDLLNACITKKVESFNKEWGLV